MKHKVIITFEIDPTQRNTTDSLDSALDIVHSILGSYEGPEEITIECEGLKRKIRKHPSSIPPPL